MTEKDILVLRKACNNPNIVIKSDNYIKEKKYYWDIFNHSFAKAFWGEEPINIADYKEVEWIPAWKLHLQQMVLLENPLEYLQRFLDV